MLMDFRPAFVVLEELPQFERHGLPVVQRLLKGIYTFEVIHLDPKIRGWPVSRPRLYCIATCSESAELTRGLAELGTSFISRRAPGCGRDFFYMDVPHDTITDAKCAILRDYVDLFGTEPNVFDLTRTLLGGLDICSRMASSLRSRKVAGCMTRQRDDFCVEPRL